VQDFVQLAPGVVVGDRIVVNLRVAAVEIVIIAGTATPDSLRKPVLPAKISRCW
jgi:hypothetical protein